MSEKFITKHPYLAAVIAALICTFLTAVGSAAAQVAELAEVPSYLVMTASVVLSILVGLWLLRRSRISAEEIGFRRPASGSVRSIWLGVPLLLLEVIPLVAYGPDAYTRPGAEYAVLALFTIMVGFNEELYFRGLAFSFLSRLTRKQAVIGSSIVFGVLHAANALSGTNPVEVLLQIVFAFLVGIVLALIVSITRSLWIGIVWHAVHNFLSFGTEVVFDQTALMVVSAQLAILLIFTVGLWKRGTAAA
ncbi:CPBP family intramembrane metalloprotease [Paenibacillus timonensis]|uniref:CPBP family intramembrane glutamic endopeptidase n=1 Tax=Paenibacillus timonensis TaxID=225915 RepID=A0ABW3S8N4_9BACL|nr:CPBP family intramembrane glutamic endopeptidase [Paenibacillus timonensis]MCH1638961.1 CPBP family intramembrane metalloprotease [Paenibacillus timonensis]